jgi:hypothetical protein
LTRIAHTGRTEPLPQAEERTIAEFRADHGQVGAERGRTTK